MRAAKKSEQTWMKNEVGLVFTNFYKYRSSKFRGSRSTLLGSKRAAAHQIFANQSTATQSTTKSYMI